MGQYRIFYTTSVESFLQEISHKASGKIRGAIRDLENGDFSSLYIKTLKSPIRELRIKRYRIIFFVHGHTIFFIRIFIKKTQKTPLQEIENAERVCARIISNLNL